MAMAFGASVCVRPRSAFASQPSAATTSSSASPRSPQPYLTRRVSLRCRSGRRVGRLEVGKPGEAARGRASWSCRAGLEAVVFDCDGVILESEDLHRRAYNAAFQEFQVRSPASSPAPLVWTPEFYDELQNTIGGGKPKMRWYFSKYGWPTSTILPNAPTSEEEQRILIDTIQDWKTEKYKDYIGSGDVDPRPGVLELMDATREKGLKLAICSAATKSSVIFTLSNLLGKERFEGLDCFLAGIKQLRFYFPNLRPFYFLMKSHLGTLGNMLGICRRGEELCFFGPAERVVGFVGDDVDKKKPDPTIYIKAAEALGVAPENCLVVEDSVIGLKAALGAGMPCIISYTSSTSSQDFSAAKAVYPNLGSVRLEDLKVLLEVTPATL